TEARDEVTPKVEAQKIDEPMAPEQKFDEVQHKLLLSGKFGVTTLSGRDDTQAEAALYSSYDVELGATWKQGGSPQFSSFITFALRAADFGEPTSSTKTLADASQLTYGLQLGGEWKPHRRWLLTGDTAYRPELFLRSKTSSVLTVDAIPIPQFGVGILY